MMSSKGQFSSWPKEAGHMLIGEMARARMDTCLLGMTFVVLNEIVGASHWCSSPTWPSLKFVTHSEGIVPETGGCKLRVTWTLSGVPLHGEDQIYAFNSCFMSIRLISLPEECPFIIAWWTWESVACAWDVFRCKVLGPMDPEAAPTDSLRGAILAQWEDLGLKS